jgi:hypothetical protein
MATAESLNDIGAQHGTGIKLLGDIIGTIANVGGAISLILDVVKLFNDKPDPAEVLLNTFLRVYAKLDARGKADDIIQRRTNLRLILKSARDVMDTLDSFVKTQPPPTEHERLLEVQKTIDALNGLAARDVSGPDDPLWQVPFVDPVFWTDAGSHMWPVLIAGSLLVPVDRGYGTQAPPTVGPEGVLVFNYFYVLTAYIEALFAFLAALEALLPDFRKRFPDQVAKLREVVNTLQDRHDTIVRRGGITPISPGFWDRQKLLDTLTDLGRQPALAGIPVVPGFTPLAPPPLIPLPFPLLPEQLGGVNIEYGAVETFSGTSSMGDYKITFQDIEAMPASAAFNKFQIRLDKRAKDVYVAVGLLDVWRIINRLKAILGDAPLLRPNFADWTVRKDILNEGALPRRIPPRQDGFFHLSDVFRFLKNTVPQDTPPSPVNSFRNLLI